MEQAILAELWQVLDSSDLESVTSKEVGRVAVSGGLRLTLFFRAFLILLSSSSEAFPNPRL